VRKGERRKEQILDIAQHLFCEQGYDRTSLDELLSALSLSKGGFYHHFISKEHLLIEICRKKAQETAQRANQAVNLCSGSWAEKFNALFDAYGLMDAQDADFMGLMMTIPDSIVRDRLKKELSAQMLPLLQDIVLSGASAGEFATPYPEGTAELILQLGVSFSDTISAALCGAEETLNTAKILSDLELYRYAIEQVLGAPYGSIVLYELRPMTESLQRIFDKRQKRSPGGQK